MAQKDKVKELVGKGLHSYRTKSLQQIDRIEKKNKEQNHKINILTNELDNNYLTKTEEGSVIPLEHSKEGMIYIDGLEGNTLVNYCTDGSKELILNGDIDCEGTNISTSNGADNGLIDVICKGNTLINLADIGSEFHGVNITNWYADYTLCKTSKLKLNTPYTFIVYKEYLANHSTNYNQFQIGICDYLNGTTGHPNMVINKGTIYFNNDKIETIKFVVTFTSFKNATYLSVRPCRRNTTPIEGESANYNIKVVILEGDYTDKEIPPYFEGMKSVGECEGNKIEILSSKYKANFFVNSQCLKMNPNNTGLGTSILMTDESEKYYRAIPDENRNVSLYSRLQKSEDFESGQEYIISVMVRSQKDAYINIYDNGNISATNNNIFVRANEWTTITTNPTNISKTDALILVSSVYDSYLDYKNFKLEKGSIASGWMPCIADESYSTWNLLNKKEISLNEPLRGLSSGIEDRFVKQGGKWYVERNTCEYKISGNETMLTFTTDDSLLTQYYITGLPNMYVSTTEINGISDKYSFISSKDRFLESSHNKLWCGNSHICLMYLKSSNLSTTDAKNLLKDTTVIYRLATPTYEEIIDVELITYLDVTYISNNSTIPCNMKIQNSGYNAIIKPSTQYTVALDTNKSGTIGLNLGGAKVTTTNNVATITTPATLADDSLRLYGKGINASKVRLLEGDKTNWIPSHFEGMQSSFEDKLQEDGTYKMEILSNKGGMNLCTNSDDIRGVVASGIILEKVDDKGYKNVAKLSGDLSGSWFSVSSTLATKISPNTTITISVLARTDKPNNQSKLSFYLGDGQEGSYINFNEPLSNEYKWISQTRKFISNSFRPHFGLSSFNGYSVYISKMKIEFGDKMTEWCPSVKDTSWTEYKNYNKIQFSSIEPLRKWDRFVFKEGKLMIERNSGVKVFNGSEKWAYGDTSSGWNQSGNYKAFYTYSLSNTKKTNGESYTTYLPTTIGAYSVNSATSEAFSLGHANYELIRIDQTKLNELSSSGLRAYLNQNPLEVVYQLKEPIYEEIPFDMKKIILESYENGTLYFDTNIPPTSTVTYAGETSIVKSVRLNKTEVLNNSNDINDNIVPYLMDMDYRVVCLQLEGGIENISMARLFGGTYEMLQRDIQSKRHSVDEYKYRLDAYLSANKITENEYKKLGDMLND